MANAQLNIVADRCDGSDCVNNGTPSGFGETDGSDKLEKADSPVLYSVSFPMQQNGADDACEDECGSSEIFENRQEALKFMQKHKGKEPRLTPVKTKRGRRAGTGRRSPFLFASGGRATPSYPDSPAGAAAAAQSPVGDEEKPPFAAPTFPELNILKRAIETGEQPEKVGAVLDANPRYLVNYRAAAPTIIREGMTIRDPRPA